jgi:putative flippase GtrA
MIYYMPFKLIDKIFDYLEEKNKIFEKFRKITKYFFISVIATVTDIIFLYIFTEIINIFYLLSAIFSYIIGMFIAYLGNRKYTFKNNKNKKEIHKFIDFSVISIIGLVLNIILLKIFTEDFGIWYIYSKIIAVILIFFIKYIGHKKIVFNN